MSGFLTRVALVFIAQQINVYLRFGNPVRERMVDARRRVAEFAPADVFCRIRWEANQYGTTCWQLSILQALAVGEAVQRINGIVPGAALLLRADGVPGVQTVLRLIDTIEAQKIDPADVPATYWRTVHNRLAARVAAPSYALDRHVEYLAHRAVVCA
jgi:Protein of unknown function (DUF2840)